MTDEEALRGRIQRALIAAGPIPYNEEGRQTILRIIDVETIGYHLEVQPITDEQRQSRQGPTIILHLREDLS